MEKHKKLHQATWPNVPKGEEVGYALYAVYGVDVAWWCVALLCLCVCMRIVVVVVVGIRHASALLGWCLITVNQTCELQKQNMHQLGADALKNCLKTFTLKFLPLR